MGIEVIQKFALFNGVRPDKGTFGAKENGYCAKVFALVLMLRSIVGYTAVVKSQIETA